MEKSEGEPCRNAPEEPGKVTYDDGPGLRNSAGIGRRLYADQAGMIGNQDQNYRAIPRLISITFRGIVVHYVCFRNLSSCDKRGPSLFILYEHFYFWSLTALVASLQAELADCRAQLEHWQGVATICELSKQEELSELQKQCDQEIQSLQEALRGLCGAGGDCVPAECQ